MLSPKVLKECIKTCMKARLVPFIQGSPGMGKSAIVKEIADEYGLKLIDCRLSSMEPTDLLGLPWINNGKAEFNPYNLFPLEDTPIPNGYEGWLLFLDEFNSASKATQAAAYRVVLDREIGQHKLHSHCFVVAAGNLSTDNAIVNSLSTAMLSRVIHLHIGINIEDWITDFAIPNNIDDRIIAYLAMNPEYLMQFDPEKEDETFPCPRTWQFVDKLIKANSHVVNEKIIPLLAGAVTLQQATAFVQFCKVSKDLITIEDIKKNPDINLPTDTAILWATVCHISRKVTENDLKYLEKFLNKLPATFKIVFLRSLVKTNPLLIQKPFIINFAKELGDFSFD